MHRLSPSSKHPQKLVCLLMSVTLLMTLGGSFATAEQSHTSSPDLCEQVDQLAFDGNKANASVTWQVDLGPRTPGSEGSAAFRENVTTDLKNAGWEVTTSNHISHGLSLTNVFARWNSTSNTTEQVVLSAHYDSRSHADQDLNQSNRSLPVPGANDAASGVAVLLELANHIPQMNLGYDVVIFLNDAEDQGDNYTLGAEAWADNLSEAEIAATQAFILLDMIGDADLQLHNINPGNETLKSTVVELGTALGLVEGTTGCNGVAGLDIIRYDVAVGVLDDHVHPHRLGIPSIDLMDTRYGDAKSMTFGTYWHTMEDTPDKVSAESLSAVGRIVELGLRSNAFVNLDEVPIETQENNSLLSVNDEEREDEAQETQGVSGLFVIAGMSLLTTIGLIIYVEFKLKH